jgi:hypothetical protein
MVADLNKNMAAKRWEDETIRNYLKLSETSGNWIAAPGLNKNMPVKRWGR